LSIAIEFWWSLGMEFILPLRDILDLKTLRKEEKLAIPFEEYLRRRGV